MASYQLLYGDNGSEIFKKPALIWASVIVPLLLIFTFGYLIFNTHVHGLSWIVQLMFVSVGWHYVKQVFGMIIVPSAQNGVFLNGVERKIILTNLYSLWALSFLWGQSSEREASFYGVKYAIVGVSDLFIKGALAVVILTGMAAVVIILMRYLIEGRTVHPYGMLAYISLYAWYLPVSQHPHFFYMIPFFHSLQYLMFVMAVKHKENLTKFNLGEMVGRSLYVKALFKFFGVSIFSGLLFFMWLPELLDHYFMKYSPDQASLLGGSVFMASFHLFINIHHYFIDNVVWRKESKTLRILLAKSP